MKGTIMKTFSDIKKQLVEGATLKLVRHDWLTPSSKIQVGLQRKIIKRQSNAIQFEGGSWFYFPKSSDIAINENGFSVVLSIEQASFMAYEFVGA
jgi:hypothetical protein